MVKRIGQVEWSANMFKKAFERKGFYAEFPDGIKRKVIWLRGFHYFIVVLPKDQRQIPTTRGTRLYENTKQEYKNLSKIWVEAQLKGLIDSDLIWDNRNEFIIEPLSRKKIDIYDLDYKTYAGNYFEFEIYMLKTFEEFKSSVDVVPSFSENRFASQFYEMIVVTEKLTVKAYIKDICMQHGVNCLIVKGQSSFTRVKDICKKAKHSKRPILLLGIYDLDCAGWDMPTSFMKRVNQVYPHPHHKFIRVALNRDQAKEYNLPASFEPDDKGYPEAQKERFYSESGGRTCIELDAMDNIAIRESLRKELEIYSGLKLDEIQERRFKKREKKRIGHILNNFDFEPYSQKYERAYKRYAQFYGNMKQIQDYLKAKYYFLTDKVWDTKKEIKNNLKKQLENGEEIEQT
ncbi:TPA_asm: topo mini-A [Lokiarchaeia virus SkuldV3]|uniref:Topo mini-A n=1 Tax=Lokiarchaeia virus SkuldV3 TaxID=2983915 RepID=A0A9N6YJS4_9VIRU|nr:topo mini-A [Lokiarchaeia virus SkuldV3]DAZ90941.1 TPA_asm: topo mini-A [Lokiarchaeia virus SkuldV3]